MSLLCRLKKLVHKGLLKKEDLDRIVIIPKEPNDDTVSRGVFEQIKWERDIAIEQLKELGYALGQKIEHCEDAVSRQEVLKQLKCCLTGGETEYNYVKMHIDSIPHIRLKTKTGHWKLVQRNNFIDICCSECGHVRVEDFAYGYTIQQLDKESVKEFFNKNPLNFCECCGAKMEETAE